LNADWKIGLNMDHRRKPQNVLRPRPNISISGSHALAAPVKGDAGAQPRRASLMQAPVLVLNATFEPINVTAVRRALVLMLKGVAQAEETHPAEVHSTSRAVAVPSVIRLLSYRHIPQEEAGLTLARRPRPFTLHTSRQLMRLIGHKDEKWRKYLFY